MGDMVKILEIITSLKFMTSIPTNGTPDIT